CTGIWQVLVAVLVVCVAWCSNSKLVLVTRDCLTRVITSVAIMPPSNNLLGLSPCAVGPYEYPHSTRIYNWVAAFMVGIMTACTNNQHVINEAQRSAKVVVQNAWVGFTRSHNALGEGPGSTGLVEHEYCTTLFAY